MLIVSYVKINTQATNKNTVGLKSISGISPANGYFDNFNNKLWKFSGQILNSAYYCY